MEAAKLEQRNSGQEAAVRELLLRHYPKADVPHLKLFLKSRNVEKGLWQEGVRASLVGVLIKHALSQTEREMLDARATVLKGRQSAPQHQRTEKPAKVTVPEEAAASTAQRPGKMVEEPTSVGGAMRDENEESDSEEEAPMTCSSDEEDYLEGVRRSVDPLQNLSSNDTRAMK